MINWSRVPDIIWVCLVACYSVRWRDQEERTEANLLVAAIIGRRLAAASREGH